MSVLISARQHSGGGVGSVFGSKKLKGVVIIGDQPIHIHADKKEWQKITERNIDLFGSLNQHVVPSAPTPCLNSGPRQPLERYAGQRLAESQSADHAR